PLRGTPPGPGQAQQPSPPLSQNSGRNARRTSTPPGNPLLRPHDLVNLLLELEELVLETVLAVVERRIAALQVLQADLRQLDVRLRAAVEQHLEHHVLRLP